MNPDQDRLAQAVLQAVKAAIAAGLPILLAGLTSAEVRDALDHILGSSIVTGLVFDLVVAFLTGAMKWIGGPTYKVPVISGGTEAPRGRSRKTAEGVSVEKPGLFAA